MLKPHKVIPQQKSQKIAPLNRLPTSGNNVLQYCPYSPRLTAGKLIYNSGIRIGIHSRLQRRQRRTRRSSCPRGPRHRRRRPLRRCRTASSRTESLKRNFTV